MRRISGSGFKGSLRLLSLCGGNLMSAAIAALAAEGLNPNQQRAFDIYKELIEINTVTATGDTAQAAEAMAARLRAGGFPDADVHVFSPAPRKGNLVARLRGTGARKPILLLAHIDVVPASREDWSTDPFKLVEQDGYFYARGSGDDKYMAAAFVANLIRYRQEGYKPDRDIIVALETDEEILDKDALGIQWLLKNHRDLIDAEFALNEGGGVGLKDGKPIRNTRPDQRKSLGELSRSTVKNKGGHSSRPGQGQCDLSAGGGTGAALEIQLSAETQRDHARLFRTHRADGRRADRRRYARGAVGPIRSDSDVVGPALGQCRLSTRNCAPHASRRCWRADRDQRVAATGERQGQLPDHARRTGRWASRRRWNACWPTTRSW